MRSKVGMAIAREPNRTGGEGRGVHFQPYGIELDSEVVSDLFLPYFGPFWVFLGTRGDPFPTLCYRVAFGGGLGRLSEANQDTNWSPRNSHEVLGGAEWTRFQLYDIELGSEVPKEPQGKPREGPFPIL